MKNANYYTLTPYKHHYFEDNGGYVTDEFKNFAKKWKNFLTRMCENRGWTLEKFNVGHYYCSWFIKNGEKYVYCSFSDVRWGSKSWYKLILHRIAKDDNDYTGGHNWYTELENLEEAIQRRFQQGY